MNTLETDVEISADGSLKLLSPLPDWLKPGRMHLLLSVPNGATSRAKRVMPSATPEMLAKRAEALAGLRAMGGLKDVIPDPAAWQREAREDVILPDQK
ncbi:hypothetical protein [Prosthecobacter sp.]|uniref:hypothetical protein n=1 Tax=Prosthecobacter sp. TaxID=1965333 RepID=UPI003783F2C3